MSPYTVLSHTADTGIEATGSSLAELISALASGMFDLMSPVADCPRDVNVDVEASSDSLEELVVDLLSELLYESEVRDLFLCGFETTMLGPTHARISAGGIDIAAAEVVGPPIKAVTYHAMVVERRDDGWFARVYFDV